jgi:hypothetical protein
MEVLDWMSWIHDWNFWKASLDMVIALKVVEKGISCTVSCLTSLHGANEVTGFKAQDVTGH